MFADIGFLALSMAVVFATYVALTQTCPECGEEPSTGKSCPGVGTGHEELMCVNPETRLWPQRGVSAYGCGG